MRPSPAPGAASTSGIALTCGDCAGSGVLPDSADSPTLLEALHAFLAAHAECSLSVTMDLPRQRAPEGAVGS